MATEHDVVTPPNPDAGFQPAKNVHGYELTTIGAEVRGGTTVPVVTFTAYDKATGAELIVDDRTYDGATMQLAKPKGV